MFLQSKKKKIEKYLESKKSATSAFDKLLKDYLNDNLKQNLTNLGVLKTDIHIDWLNDYKCIGIQGKYHSYFVDIQIEEQHFSIAYDKDEPDDPKEYALEKADQVYSVLESTLRNISDM